MTIGLKRGIVYGPVGSRRLGRSLGINLLPRRHKLCSFDCVYCQYGATAECSPQQVEDQLPTVEQVAAALEVALGRLDQPPAWLTFSGNGEPTLHPDFPAAVDAIVELRDRLCPEAGTTVLSCSTEAGRPEIRSALDRLDARVMKLDVGNEAALQRYNRPAEGVSLAGIVDGLQRLDDLTLQTLLAGGEDGNADRRDLEDWLELVVGLRPAAVQLYSLDRPTASRSLTPVGRSELEKVAGTLRAVGVPVEVF